MREPKWIMNMKRRSKNKIDNCPFSMGHGSLLIKDEVCLQTEMQFVSAASFCNSVVKMPHTFLI